MSTVQTSTSSSLPTQISSSINQHNNKCSINCYLLTAIILISVIVCVILIRVLYVCVHKRRRINSVVDIENNASNISNDTNNNYNNFIVDINNDNRGINDSLLTTRLNHSEMSSPQNALIRNRHTISARSHPHNLPNIQHTLLKRTRTTISYIIAKNYINNVENFVGKFPLPPLSNSSPVHDDPYDDNDNKINEILKNFNKPWEFVPEVAAKEMNTVNVKNRGRIIEINPEIWSSVVKDACVQSNYPFHVPLPKQDENNNTEDKVLNEKDQIPDMKISNEKDVKDLTEISNEDSNEKDDNDKDLNDKEEITNEKDIKKTLKEKTSLEEERQESISDRIRKKLKQKKKHLQQVTNKGQKIEEKIEDYKDGEGFNYFEITILEKEDSCTNIAIGVATKPFPCYRLPGHTDYSIGYHSSTGEMYQNSMYNSWDYGPSWNDVHITVGCGYKSLSGEIYFTYNGSFLGSLYTTEVEFDIVAEKRYCLFPSIGANGKCKIRVNLGEEEFIYKDIYNEKVEEKMINNEEIIKRISRMESDYDSDDENNNDYIKNSININPLGIWKDIRLENNEKVWWNSIS